MSDELKSCPFCGVQPVLDTTFDPYFKCRCGASTAVGSTIAEAATAWNRRPSGEPATCKMCQSTGPDVPCAYPTEINRQQAQRIVELEAMLASRPAAGLMDDQEGVRQATREMIRTNPEGARLEMATMAAEIRDLKATVVTTLSDADIERAECIAYKKHGHRAGAEWTRAFAEAIRANRPTLASRPAADESAKPVDSEMIARAALGDKLRLSDTINTDWLTPTERAPVASKEAVTLNGSLIGTLHVNEIGGRKEVKATVTVLRILGGISAYDMPEGRYPLYLAQRDASKAEGQ